MDYPKMLNCYLSKQAVKLLICSLLFAGLSACGESPEEIAATAAKHLQQAKEYRGQGQRKSAIIEVKNALLKSPSNLEARELLGELYLKIGDLAAAEQTLERVFQKEGASPLSKLNYAKTLLQLNKLDELNRLVSDPVYLPEEIRAEFHTLSAHAALAKGNADEARAELKSAALIIPEHPEVLLLKALFASYGGELDETRDILDHVLKIDPENTRALQFRGEIAFSQGDFDAARKAFEKASNIEFVNLALKTNLVRTLIAEEYFDEAETQLRPILNDAPDYPFANQLQANISLRKKNYASALEHAEKVLNQTPDDLQSAYVAAMAAYSLGRFEKAYQHANRVVRLTPQYSGALKLQAAIQLKLGLTKEAQNTLSRIDRRALTPEDASLFAAIGVAAQQSGNALESQQFFQQALELAPDDELTSVGLASVYLVQGRTEAGIAALESAVERVPESQATQMILILSYLKNQQIGKALATVQAFQQRYPESPHGFTLEGLILIFQKKVDEAESAFQQALSLRQGDLNASHNLAALAMNKQDPDTARTVYTELLKHHPNNLKTLMLLFELEVQVQRSDAAIKWLELAVEKHPEALRPYLLLGHILLAQNQPARALGLAEKIRAFHPRNPILLAQIAQAQVQAGQKAEAINTYEQLKEITSDQLLPNSRMADIFEKDGQLVRAQEYVDKALAIDPQHSRSLLTQGRIALKTGDLEKAISVRDSLKEYTPDSSWFMELDAQVTLAQGKPAEAVELYRKVFAQRQTNFVNIQLATALLVLGQQDQAIETLTQWMEQYPEDLLTLDTLANWYLVSGQLEQSKAAFSDMVRQMPNHTWAHNNLAWLLLKEGNVEQALVHAKRARQLAPRSPDIMDTLGTIFLKNGDIREAEKLLSNAVKLRPEDLEIQFHLAEAHAKNGQEEKAKRRLERILGEENVNSRFASREDARRLLESLSNSDS